MSHKDFLWCGEGDLFSRPPLKTRKLYTSQRAKSAQRARNTKSSHTASHTGGFTGAVSTRSQPLLAASARLIRSLATIARRAQTPHRAVVGSGLVTAL
jgi:hypothetical protein